MPSLIPSKLHPSTNGKSDILQLLSHQISFTKRLHSASRVHQRSETFLNHDPSFDKNMKSGKREATTVASKVVYCPQKNVETDTTLDFLVFI